MVYPISFFYDIRYVVCIFSLQNRSKCCHFFWIGGRLIDQDMLMVFTLRQAGHHVPIWAHEYQTPPNPSALLSSPLPKGPSLSAGGPQGLLEQHCRRVDRAQLNRFQHTLTLPQTRPILQPETLPSAKKETARKAQLRKLPHCLLCLW